MRAGDGKGRGGAPGRGRGRGRGRPRALSAQEASDALDRTPVALDALVRAQHGHLDAAPTPTSAADRAAHARDVKRTQKDSKRIHGLESALHDIRKEANESLSDVGAVSREVRSSEKLAKLLLAHSYRVAAPNLLSGPDHERKMQP